MYLVSQVLYELFFLTCVYSGEVMCTIHSKVVEDHQKELHPGAVLVLRQVSIKSNLSCVFSNSIVTVESLYKGTPE